VAPRDVSPLPQGERSGKTRLSSQDSEKAGAECLRHVTYTLGCKGAEMNEGLSKRNGAELSCSSGRAQGG
jgi:hypothetical protein